MFYRHQIEHCPHFRTQYLAQVTFSRRFSWKPLKMFRSQKRLRNKLSSANQLESPLDGTQKNLTQPVYVKTAQELISRMDDKRSNVFNALLAKLGSLCLNAIPCKNRVQKLDVPQLRISIA